MIPHINQGRSDGISFFGCKYQSCRIFPVPQSQWIYTYTYISISNGWADFQHMCFQNPFFSRNQIICVIFHKRSSPGIFYTCCHKFYQTEKRRCLPVTFCCKSIAFFHQSLHCKSRKLFQFTKLSKMCYNCLIILFFQKSFKSNFNSCLFFYMSSEFTWISAFQNNTVFLIIFICQSLYIDLRYTFYSFRCLYDGISIHLPAKF